MLWAVPAKADLMSVHADIPLSFSPTQEGADTPDSISGARVGLSLFILPLGIAYESYEVSYTRDTVDSKDTYQIASLFVNLPVPVINIALGAGAGMVTGEGELSNGTKLTADDSAATSLFATLGYPILPLFDPSSTSCLLCERPLRSLSLRECLPLGLSLTFHKGP